MLPASPSPTFQSALRFHRVSDITLFQAFKFNDKREPWAAAAGLMVVIVKQNEAELKARERESVCVCMCVYARARTESTRKREDRCDLFLFFLPILSSRTSAT